MEVNTRAALQFKELEAQVNIIGNFASLPANGTFIGTIVSDEPIVRDSRKGEMSKASNGDDRVLFLIKCEFEIGGVVKNINIPCNSAENAAKIWKGNKIFVSTKNAAGFPSLQAIASPAEVDAALKGQVGQTVTA